MDIKRKVELAERSVESIARHDDADLRLRNAALDRLAQKIEAERAAANKRVQTVIEASVGFVPTV